MEDKLIKKYPHLANEINEMDDSRPRISMEQLKEFYKIMEKNKPLIFEELPGEEPEKSKDDNND